MNQKPVLQSSVLDSMFTIFTNHLKGRWAAKTDYMLMMESDYTRSNQVQCPREMRTCLSPKASV